jgi:hypothetical protein
VTELLHGANLLLRFLSPLMTDGLSLDLRQLGECGEEWA